MDYEPVPLKPTRPQRVRHCIRTLHGTLVEYWTEKSESLGLWQLTMSIRDKDDNYVYGCTFWLERPASNTDLIGLAAACSGASKALKARIGD